MSDHLKPCPDCGADIPVDGAPCGQKRTPPAPPGLDWEAAKREALAKFCARFSCTPEDIKKYEESLFEVGVWIKDALQNQHLAALQQARKDKDTEWYARADALVAEAKREERERIKRHQHGALSAMLAANRDLYAQCLDAPGFAYWFNQLTTLPSEPK